MHYRNFYQLFHSYFYHFFRRIFRIHYFLTFSCCFFLWTLYWFGVFLLMFYMFLLCFLLIVAIIIYQQVLLFLMFILILTKMVTAFKAIITPFWIIFGYFLQPCFFSWKFVSLSEVISRRFINMKLRFLVISIVSLMLFLHKHIKTPDHNESIRSCSKHESFTFDYIDTCENIQSLETQLTINHF